MNLLRSLDAAPRKRDARSRAAAYTLSHGAAVKGMLLAASLFALAAGGPVAADVPGVVILDPASSSQSRAMEQQLARAGYATLA